MIEDWSIHTFEDSSRYSDLRGYVIRHPRGVTLVGPQYHISRAGYVCFYVAFATTEMNYHPVVLETFTSAQFLRTDARYVFIPSIDFAMLKMAAS